jgi:DNA-directed RNA polymerase subunit RPC12/RpoP
MIYVCRDCGQTRIVGSDTWWEPGKARCEACGGTLIRWNEEPIL